MSEFVLVITRYHKFPHSLHGQRGQCVQICRNRCNLAQPSAAFQNVYQFVLASHPSQFETCTFIWNARTFSQRAQLSKRTHVQTHINLCSADVLGKLVYTICNFIPAWYSVWHGSCHLVSFFFWKIHLTFDARFFLAMGLAFDLLFVCPDVSGIFLQVYVTLYPTRYLADYRFAPGKCE